MRKLEWKIPEKFAEKYVGKVVVNLPNYTAKLKLVKECNFAMGKDGVADASQLDSFVKMIEVAEKYIETVELKHIPSGIEVKTFQEAQDYVEFDEIIPELASIVFGGGQISGPLEVK